MTIITNLTGDAVQSPDAHPIRQSIRAGMHTTPNDGVSRFIGIWDKELHLHHAKSIVVIPLDELFKLAAEKDPSFNEDPGKV